MFIVKDRELKKLIEGKKVVILGSAPSVLKNTAAFIDSFDIVVRLNNYKVIGFEEKVGNRTDIYYSFFGRSITKGNAELKRQGIKLIMCKYPNEEFLSHTGGKPVAGISDKCTWVYEFREDWWLHPMWIPKLKYFRENFNYLDRILTTGMSAIYDILRFDPGSIYITGFDFMTSGVHNVDEKWQTGDGNHDHNGEMKLVSKLVHRGKINCDEHIKKLIYKYQGNNAS